MVPPSSGRKCIRKARSAGYLDKLSLRTRKGIIPPITGYTAHSHYVLESSWFQILSRDQYPEIFDGFSQFLMA